MGCSSMLERPLGLAAVVALAAFRRTDQRGGDGARANKTGRHAFPFALAFATATLARWPDGRGTMRTFVPFLRRAGLAALLGANLSPAALGQAQPLKIV